MGSIITNVRDFLNTESIAGETELLYSHLFRLLAQRQNYKYLYVKTLESGNIEDVEFIVDNVELINNDIIKLLKL